MEPLKEMFNEAYYQKLTQILASIQPKIDKKKFLKDATHELSSKALNDRLRHTATILKVHLPEKYKEAIMVLDQVIVRMDKGYTALVFPEYVAQFGLDYPDLSMAALKRYTAYGSSEFAIRHFLKKDLEYTLDKMVRWADDKNHHVRRLACEGSRPRLPWSFKLDSIIQNPRLTQPILSKLKADPELYVRKSVANHLNDITKDHPEYVIEVVAGWDRKYEHTLWIVKHACRTLIKKGNVKALALFDVQNKAHLHIDGFEAHPKKIMLGGRLDLTCDFYSTGTNIQKLIIDYIIHYIKKDGTASPKVFKWKECSVLPGQHIHLKKSQTIMDFSTRVHHPGVHKIELQVNGNVLAATAFKLEPRLKGSK